MRVQVVQSRKQMASLSKSMNAMQTQASQTQRLLTVVQEQKRTLQEDNKALRDELDRVYSGSMGATRALPAPPTSSSATGTSSVAHVSAGGSGNGTARGVGASPLDRLQASLQGRRS